jgi:GH15 family glucan-1,4-alpha-glucosidase
LEVTRASAALVPASLDALCRGQTDGGGFVAGPAFPTYRYVWLRDGSFCAYAFERYGRADRAAAFHRFVARALLRDPRRVERAISAGSFGGEPRWMLPTRFTVDGTEEANSDVAWPNFQLDGYGAWLWTLADHVARGGELTGELREAAELVARYLRTAGHLPCFDCWEEYGDKQHTATVAAVLAGLSAARTLLGGDPVPGWPLSIVDGSLVKFAGSSQVDGSLLSVALPFGVLSVRDPLMVSTVRRIEAELVGPGGGVRRYLGDTYYGGGDWILLTAWLGWYRAVRGDLAGALRARSWIEAAATPDGQLPEQLIDAPQQPEMVKPWIAKWGPVATPLLWSHAMYLILADAIDACG